MKNIQRLALVFSIASALFSCTNLEVRMPKGPQGEQGIPGRDGLSAYEVWVKAVHDGIITYPGTTEINDFFIYLKGKDGKDGLTPQVADGKDGIPQWIFVKGQNDTVWTGVPAAGRDGKDGKNGLSAYEIWKTSVAEGIQDPKNPGQTWPKDRTSTADFYKFLTGNDGDDGLTPYVGTNGNWFIGKTDTGVPATGPQGPKGDTGATGAAGQTPHVGDNGNWFIGGKDTGVKARGPRGDTGATGATGTDGLSAYELWVKDVKSENGLEDPKNPGSLWPKDKTTVADFYEYLKGADGLSAYEIWVKAVTDGTIVHEGGTTVTEYFKYLKGEKGEPGADGKDGKTPTIGGNGNWFIDGKDTGVKAQGDPGTNGLSAYELWLKDVATGTLQDPKHPGQTWPTDKTTMADFYDYLTGPKGDDGLVPYIGGNGNWFIGNTDTGVPAKGKDGANGTDGKSAYEIWKALAQTGDLDDPHNPGAKWDKNKLSVDDFWAYLSGVDGKDGKDGLTPTVGANGNWFIGNTDTGVPARGQDGATPTIGNNGNWFIGTTDTGVPAKGKDGADGTNGLSAYELWVKDVKSAAGLEDPHDPGTKWDPAKTTPADFWRYLQGRDGKDGKSAYELWKEIVDQGKMDNPKTDDETDFWPADSNTIEWFWEYLKGKDGKDATATIVVGADKTKFNLVPMPAVNYDGTDEYVNPFTGGVTYRACAPNYVVLANCKVDLPMPDGTTLTLNTDINGYVHMPVDKLPAWTTGATPGGITVKPSQFTLVDGTVINDSNNIAQTCKIPYRVETQIRTVVDTRSPQLDVRGDFNSKHGIVRTKFNVKRTVEGVSGIMNFSKMKYYVLNGSETIDMTKSIYGKIGIIIDNKTESFYNISNDATTASINRSNDGKTFVANLSFGNGPEGPTVNYATSVTLTKTGYWPDAWLPDYGSKSKDDVLIEIPAVNRMGGFLIKNPADATDIYTQYLLYTGYADLQFVLDLNSFGWTYVNYNEDRNGTGNAARQDADGIYRFKYFPSLKALMNDAEYNCIVSDMHSDFRNQGRFNGTKIDNTISFGKEAFETDTPVKIKNVYNNFEIEFYEFISTTYSIYSNILYQGKRGKFITKMKLGTPSTVKWSGEEGVDIPTNPGLPTTP